MELVDIAVEWSGESIGLLQKGNCSRFTSSALANAYHLLIVKSQVSSGDILENVQACVENTKLTAQGAMLAALESNTFAVVYQMEASGQGYLAVAGVQVSNFTSGNFTENSRVFESTKGAIVIKAVGPHYDSSDAKTTLNVMLVADGNQYGLLHKLDVMDSTDISYIFKIAREHFNQMIYNSWPFASFAHSADSILPSNLGQLLILKENQVVRVLNSPKGPHSHTFEQNSNLQQINSENAVHNSDQATVSFSWKFMNSYTVDTTDMMIDATTDSGFQALMVRNAFNLQITNTLPSNTTISIKSTESIVFDNDYPLVVAESCPYTDQNPISHYELDLKTEFVSLTHEATSKNMTQSLLVKMTRNDIAHQEKLTLKVDNTDDINWDRSAFPLGMYTVTYKLTLKNELQFDYNAKQSQTMDINVTFAPCEPGLIDTSGWPESVNMELRFYAHHLSGISTFFLTPIFQNDCVLDVIGQLETKDELSHEYQNVTSSANPYYGLSLYGKDRFKITISENYPLDRTGIENLRLTLFNAEDNNSTIQQIYFQIDHQPIDCVGSMSLPAGDPNFEFVYILTDGRKEFELSGASFGNCKFNALIISENGTTLMELDYIQKFHPIFENLTAGTNFQYELITPPVLELNATPDQTDLIGVHAFCLTLQGDRYESDPAELQGTIKLIIAECSVVAEDSEAQGEVFTYEIGTPALEIGFATINKTCNWSSLEVTDGAGEELDANLFGVAYDDQLRQGVVSVETEDVSYADSNFTVKVVESDLASGKKAVTVHSVQIQLPPEVEMLSSQGNVTKFDGMAIDAGEQGTDVSEQTIDAASNPPSSEEINSEGGSDEDDEGGNSEEESDLIADVQALVVHDEHGNVFYPWQLRSSPNKQAEVGRFVIEKLVAEVTEISATGLVTIGFSKPIIIPPFKIGQGRQLAAKLIDISQVVDMRILQPFVDADEEGDGYIPPSVAQIFIKELTETIIDLQLEIGSSQRISKSPLYSDQLEIRFKLGQVFMDRQDLTQLDNDFVIVTDIIPQMTTEEIAQLQSISDGIEASLDTISTVVLGFQLFLAFGLKYLFGIMNLLQFLIYMQSWQILLSSVAALFLRKLKSLAFLEFIPTQWFKDAVNEFFGVCAESDLSCRGEQTNSDVIEKVGASRIGSTSLVNNMGTMLLIAVGILVALLILLGLRAVIKCSDRIRSLYEKLKRKIFWNSIIRYILQSNLKMQVAACTILFIHFTSQKTVGSGQLSVASITVVFFWLCPLIFMVILVRNRSQLYVPVIVAKIGSLYKGMDARKPHVVRYSVLFLLRRCFFTLIMFLLFNQPLFQTLAMELLSCLQIMFLLTANFFGSPLFRRVEVINECVFLVVQGLFLASTDIAMDAPLRNRLGAHIIGLLSVLIAANLVLIVWTSVAKIRRKLRLQKARKDNERAQAQKIAFKEEAVAEAEKFRQEYFANKDQMIDFFYKGYAFTQQAPTERRSKRAREGSARSDSKLLQPQKEPETPTPVGKLDIPDDLFGEDVSQNIVPVKETARQGHKNGSKKAKTNVGLVDMSFIEEEGSAKKSLDSNSNSDGASIRGVLSQKVSSFGVYLARSGADN